MSFLERIDTELAAAEGGLQLALEATIQELRAESGSVHLLEADGVLHLKAASGLPQVVLDIVRLVPMGKGMAGLAALRAEPVTACNIQTDSTGDVRPGARATGMEGAIVVPVLDGEGKAVGSLGVANRQERTFTVEETALLLEVGKRMAKRA